jgi:bifunctional non-homologous end joining protein LigD
VTTALSLLGLEERELVVTAPAPSHADVMKAVLTDDRFDDPEWIYERKLDGIRCLAVRSGERVRLLSRNDLAMNDRYPEVAEGLEQEACSQFAVDGEIVAFDGPETSFSLLTQRAHHYVPVFLYVFDLIWLEGYDLRALPLRSRKRALRGALEFIGSVRYTQYRNEKGKELYEEACRKGWEGVIAKRADSKYTATRSRDWLKFKCGHGQELVIGGFTEPRGSRTEFGALLLGYYADGELQYAGKVGTGFDFDTLRDLGAAMRALRVDAPPFADPASIRERGVTWVKPELVAEIGFSEWTPYGRLRHPRFLGLRDDKAASEVVREGP